MPAGIILAGGAPDPHLAPGLPNKAFLDLHGGPILARVFAALTGCAAIEGVVVVGPPAPVAALLGAGVQVVPEQASMMDNISAAVAALPGVQQVLTVAADLPLLRADTIQSFLDRCPPDADVCYPIVPQPIVESRYPGARKTYVKVTDGTFTGGSVLLFRAPLIGQVRPLVEQIIAARKNPVQLGRLFGGALVFKFLAGRLSIADVEARVHELTGIRARAVIFDGPEIALDVDAERPENVAVLRDALAAGEGR